MTNDDDSVDPEVRRRLGGVRDEFSVRPEPDHRLHELLGTRPAAASMPGSPPLAADARPAPEPTVALITPAEERKPRPVAILAIAAAMAVVAGIGVANLLPRDDADPTATVGEPASAAQALASEIPDEGTTDVESAEVPSRPAAEGFEQHQEWLTCVFEGLDESLAIRGGEMSLDFADQLSECGDPPPLEIPPEIEEWIEDCQDTASDEGNGWHSFCGWSADDFNFDDIPFDDFEFDFDGSDLPFGELFDELEGLEDFDFNFPEIPELYLPFDDPSEGDA